MSETLDNIKAIIGNIKDINNIQDTEKARVSLLGKSGHITLLMRGLKDIAEPNQKKERAKQLNILKAEANSLLEDKKQQLQKIQLQQQLQKEYIDVTLPVNYNNYKNQHPLYYVINEITDIFMSLGFEMKEGPDIEDEYYNFTALNIDENHPARQMHDTFYLEDIKGEGNKSSISDFTNLLRTHTSAVQIREMQNGQAPFKIIAPGRTYRSDSDITHSPMFHQIEGLYIAENINMGHLKYCLDYFVKKFFESDNIEMRFRNSYFPFTEPSAEMDIACFRDKNKIEIGGKVNNDWMEILGCGMVHPELLENLNINSKKYTGFAFGIGIERLAMLKYGISDLRTFFTSNKNWLKHYGF